MLFFPRFIFPPHLNYYGEYLFSSHNVSTIIAAQSHLVLLGYALDCTNAVHPVTYQIASLLLEE